MRMAGANVHSGNLYDGAVAWNRGGLQTYSALSGVNSTTIIFSGGGRLNSILVTTNINSGAPVYFVDAVPVATSGMPLVNSGHKVVGVIPPVWAVGGSGNLLTGSQPGAPQTVDIVFFSGLIACPAASGTAAFTVCYTPEISGFFQPA